MIDYEKADQIVGSTDVARAESKSGRSKALAGDDKGDKAAPGKPKGNVVEREMKLDRYVEVFSRVHGAVSAAERACQKRKDTLQSEKEMDSAVEDILNDLVRVIQEIRDERKEIIAEAPKDPHYQTLLSR
jgi:hypothetical protein